MGDIMDITATGSRDFTEQFCSEVSLPTILLAQSAKTALTRAD